MFLAYYRARCRYESLTNISIRSNSSSKLSCAVISKISNFLRLKHLPKVGQQEIRRIRQCLVKFGIVAYDIFKKNFTHKSMQFFFFISF